MLEKLGILGICTVILAGGVLLQEVRYTKDGYAACRNLKDWSAQHEAREEAPKRWYGTMRNSPCWITDDSTPVYVKFTRHPTAVQIRRAEMKGDSLWWVWKGALR